jgi:hypothetical protein
MKIVECPLCHTRKKVYNRQRFFRCCSTLFEVEKYKLVEGFSFGKKKGEKQDETEESAPRGADFLVTLE